VAPGAYVEEVMQELVASSPDLIAAAVAAMDESGAEAVTQ
jgi:hypothetical protein